MLATLLFGLPLLVPVQVESAQDVLVARATQNNVQLTTMTAEIVTETPKTVTVAVTESEYQKEQAAAKAAAAKVIAVSAVTGTPVTASEEEKLAWVKQAASAFSIDWRVLNAVWQKESGRQFYTVTRSYAGAQGPCQFMPGTWRGYAKDGNGDGVKNVNDARDCLFGAADLLARNGAAAGDYHRALLSYNHAEWYVKAVLKLAYGS